MTRVSRFMVLGTVALVATIVAAPAVDAGCGSPTLWGQFDQTGADGYHVISFPPNVANDAATVQGRCWEAGNFSLARCGNYTDEGWLIFSSVYQTFYLNGDMQNAELGCPFNEAIVVIETLGTGPNAGKAYAAVSRVDGLDNQAARFNFNRTSADIVLTEIPTPQVVNRNQVGSVVTHDLGFPSSQTLFTGAGPNASNFASAVTFRVVRKNATTNADDSRSPAGWTLAAAVPPAGGTVSVPVDCATVPGQDVLLGTQLVLQDGQFGNLISRSVLVKCNGNVADPSTNFKIIPRKTTNRPSR